MKNIKDIIVEENVSLKKYNTYRIEALAKYLVSVLSIEGLIDLIKYLKENQVKYFILGAGSNIILDDYFDGVVIKLDKINNIDINDLEVRAGAGAMMGRLSRATVDKNLTGLEWAINIPGTIGGSINGNAGAYNSEIFDNLISLKVLTNNLEVKDINKEEIKYSYRSTNIKDLGLIVLEATFKLEEGNKQESLDKIKDRCERRKETQPLDMPSAGSVFRNPENDHAGRLIEASGLKGKIIGGAQVSLKHANFIVNTGTATSKDIKNLIKLVQDTVKEKFGVELILEQEIIDWK